MFQTKRPAFNKPTGFDSVIQSKTDIEADKLVLGEGVTNVEGRIKAKTIVAGENTTCLVLSKGSIVEVDEVSVPKLMISSVFYADLVLAEEVCIDEAAQVNVEKLRYRTLYIPPTAKISGCLEHIDSAT